MDGNAGFVLHVCKDAEKMVYHPKGGGGCLADVLCNGMGAKRSKATEARMGA
jgi:hypothetical protein